MKLNKDGVQKTIDGVKRYKVSLLNHSISEDNDGGWVWAADYDEAIWMLKEQIKELQKQITNHTKVYRDTSSITITQDRPFDLSAIQEVVTNYLPEHGRGTCPIIGLHLSRGWSYLGWKNDKEIYNLKIDYQLR